jgi:hypothetical protein
MAGLSSADPGGADISTDIQINAIHIQLHRIVFISISRLCFESAPIPAGVTVDFENRKSEFSNGHTGQRAQPANRAYARVTA